MPLTDRGKLLLVTAVGLYASGRTLGIDEAIVGAVAIVVLVVLAVAYTRIASAQLAARRHVHPGRLFFDAEATVDLDLRNEGRLPTASLLVEDAVPASLADPPRAVLDPLAPGGQARVAYSLRGRSRGRYDIGPATVRMRDPFGIAQRPVRFGATDELIVYPPVYALPDALPRTGRHGSASEGPTRPLAPSGEFANVREYIRGDDLRKVHWRSTAHRGKLMVKQEEAPQEAQATLVLDLRRRAHRGAGPSSTFETAVTVAASAAYHLSERRYRLRLVTGIVDRPPPSVPWELVVDQLAVVHPRHSGSLLPVWQQLGSGTAGDGVLVAIVTVPDAAELREMVRAGRAFGGRVAVLVAPASRRDSTGVAVDQAMAALRTAGWRATIVRPGERIDLAWRELALVPTRAPARALV